MAGTDERGNVIDMTAAPNNNGDGKSSGDDIAVITDDPDRGPSRRRMALATVAGIVIVAVAVWAFVFRDNGSSATTAPTSVVSPVINPSPTQPAPKVKPKAATPTATATTVAAPPTTVANANTPKATNPSQQAAPPPATSPRAISPVHAPSTPASSPISVLQWTSPTALTIASGGTKTVTIAAHNPSNGIVSLPHPLSCAPRLQHDEVCPEMVQMIAPGATARASFVVDATNVAPGRYTLAIENARTITVTVT